MTFLKWMFLLPSLIYLSSCGVIVSGTPWHKEDRIGPKLFGNSRAKVVMRCALIGQMWTGGPCEGALIDQDDNKVMESALEIEADNYILKHSNRGRYRRFFINGIQADSFKYNILTISPLVIIAIPNNDPYHPNSCSGSKGNCGYSQIVDLNIGYFYADDIKVEVGSFWFEPDTDLPIQYIPDNVQRYEIKLKDSKISLLKNSGIWDVDREKY